MTNAEAARRLHLSVHAIKFHLAAIYRRLGVTTAPRPRSVPPLDRRQPRPGPQGGLTWTSGSTFRVLWRFKLLVVARVRCSRCALAALSVVRVGADGLTLPDSELWSSTTRARS